MAQVAVLIVPSLKGETVEGYSLQVVEKWKLGTEKKDNGVLFMIALKERKLRIEVGQGLEGVLTDAKASRIIRENVSPLFKEQKFNEGVLVGAFLITKSLIGAKKAQEVFNTSVNKLSSKGRKKNRSSLFFLFLFIIFPLFGNRGGFLSYLFLGSLLGGGRGGFSGGGGFGGFGGGGGGFSGGGASGSW